MPPCSVRSATRGCPPAQCSHHCCSVPSLSPAQVGRRCWVDGPSDSAYRLSAASLRGKRRDVDPASAAKGHAFNCRASSDPLGPSLPLLYRGVTAQDQQGTPRRKGWLVAYGRAPRTLACVAVVPTSQPWPRPAMGRASATPAFTAPAKHSPPNRLGSAVQYSSLRAPVCRPWLPSACAWSPLRSAAFMQGTGARCSAGEHYFHFCALGIPALR